MIDDKPRKGEGREHERWSGIYSRSVALSGTGTSKSSVRVNESNQFKFDGYNL